VNGLGKEKEKKDEKKGKKAAPRNPKAPPRRWHPSVRFSVRRPKNELLKPRRGKEGINVSRTACGQSRPRLAEGGTGRPS